MKKLYALLLLVTTGIVITAAAVKSEDAKPVVTIDLARMNVLYMGVENPISIHVDGVPDEQVQPRIVGGSMRRDTAAGRYIVNVSSGTKAIINVFYRKGDEEIACGSFEYRIKRIPDPVTFINHVSNDGVILKEDLVKISGVFSRMVNFDFDCTFNVAKYSMSVIEDGEWKEYTAGGPALTPEMKTALTKCEELDKVLFHNVMVKGPDGTIRHVNCVAITVM